MPLLQELLRASRQREERLLALLAEKDRQIALVLEERFYKPVLTPAADRPQPTMTAITSDPETTQFNPEADKKAIAADDERARQAQEKLDAELAVQFTELAAEHHDWQPVERVTDGAAAPTDAAAYPNAGTIEVLDKQEVQYERQPEQLRDKKARAAAAIQELAEP